MKRENVKRESSYFSKEKFMINIIKGHVKVLNRRSMVIRLYEFLVRAGLGSNIYMNIKTSPDPFEKIILGSY